MIKRIGSVRKGYDKMDSVISKIIELDNISKKKIREIKEKEENIENYISEKIESEKEKIDSKYMYKRKILQEKYDAMLLEKKKIIDEETNRQINNIHENYEKNKQITLQKLLNEII